MITYDPRGCGSSTHSGPYDVTAEILEKSEGEALLPDSKALFVARVGAETQARVGVPLELAVNPARLHFFDANTGARLPLNAESADVVPAEELSLEDLDDDEDETGEEGLEDIEDVAEPTQADLTKPAE